MKRFLATAMFSIIILTNVLAFPVLTVAQDTTIQNDTLHITPYGSKIQAKALGNFAVIGTDKIAFQTYAGFNVLNTLRGHVPNFSIGPNASPASTGTRSGESLMVIDGLPLNSSISNYYNLNSFEYQNVYSLSSGNATALYGGSDANGAFFLQSKTGENFSRPTFEFNSYSSLLWSESQPAFLTGDSETSTQTAFTNSVAYKQDFGLVDTRVSYAYTHLPDGSDDLYNRSNYHNLRINTGFAITPRFKARLILDDFRTKSQSSLDYIFMGQSLISASEAIRKNLQGNLQLQYQVLDWLTISTQSSLAKIENNSEQLSPSVSETNRKQKRSFANVYAAVHKSLNSDFTLTTFAGFQYEKLKQEQQSKSSYGTSGYFSENKTTSVIGGLGLQFRNYLFADFNYRRDYLSVYASENNSVPTYSINASFIFSEAFSMKNEWFSFGKIRSSIGKNSVALRQGYPDEWLGSSVNAYPNSDLHASEKQMFESGIDLGFIQNRITINTTYFSDHHDQMAMQVPTPNGSNGISYVLVNIGTLDTKGWEIILGLTPIKKSNFSLETKIIWANYQNKLDNSSGFNLGGNSFPVIRGGVIIINQPSNNPTQGISLGNPYPDWSGSLLNQITFKNFFTSFLIDVTEGGVLYNVDYSSGIPSYSMQDGGIAKLRDLSIGYRLSSSILNKLKIHEAQLSISGRNMWTIYSKSGSDVEGSFSSTPQKSASLSLTLMF